MVVTFIALLELVKLGTVAVVQSEAFGEISIAARTPEGRAADASAEPQVSA
jgi:chromatin segregation and condensation protein Rec8/ScpA/Scc1 (kleisin family)